MIIAGALFFPLYLHLERGQIDLLLLPLVVAAWLRRDRVFLAGGVLVLAATFKPALLGLLPVMFALGYRRWALATIACCAVAAAATVAISGPRLVRAYVTDVLPRAALYGEGGPTTCCCTEHLEEGDDEVGERASLEGVSYQIAVPPFDGPASASLPRLLAPGSPTGRPACCPSRSSSTGLAWVARRLPRRSEDDHGDEGCSTIP